MVGVACPENPGDSVKNSFGRNFNAAAEACNARSRHNSFESAVIELHTGDANHFIESLHVGMGRAVKEGV